jgi:hypothetical protein
MVGGGRSCGIACEFNLRQSRLGKGHELEQGGVGEARELPPQVTAHRAC